MIKLIALVAILVSDVFISYITKDLKYINIYMIIFKMYVKWEDSLLLRTLAVTLLLGVKN